MDTLVLRCYVTKRSEGHTSKKNILLKVRHYSTAETGSLEKKSPFFLSNVSEAVVLQRHFLSRYK